VAQGVATLAGTIREADLRLIPMRAPSAQFHRVADPETTELPRRLDAVNHAFHGAYRRRSGVRERLLRDADLAASLEPQFADLGTHALRSALQEVREPFRTGNIDLRPDLLLRGLALLREAARRECGLQPYPVQLAGALALHRGHLAEMATGEGKTLVAALAAVLAGWSGRPCHVVTVNDYLAARDAAWFRPLLTFAGLDVAAVTGDLDPRQRRESYASAVVYTTAKELLADYLRDRLALGESGFAERLALRLAVRGTSENVVQRGLDTAIVDEADSVLIDEAVTPLIISREAVNTALRDACVEAQRLSAEFERDVDYKVNRRYKEVELKPAGRAKLAQLAGRMPPLWRGEERRRELLEQALNAREFFERDRHYVVQEGKVTIVDEFTGRLMPQRTWRDGLHQAIEAREGLEVTHPTETLARMSFQRFFRQFRRLSGMTGTGLEAAGEFWQIYRLPVVTIPTHRPCVRAQWADRVFPTSVEKWCAVAVEIARVHVTGRPILVGTRSVEASEALAAKLLATGMTPRVLNAVRHREEAGIIAQAGDRGAVTIATNMAGRGTDIRLANGVAELGGLHVISTERHESARIDRQLFGRAGRQGDAGSAQAFVSAEDELLKRFLAAPVHKLLGRIPAGGATLDKAMRFAVSRAQARAQSQAYRQRRAVLQQDQWLEEWLGFTGSGKT
jgi:preprotein translocase subunit SecA